MFKDLNGEFKNAVSRVSHPSPTPELEGVHYEPINSNWAFIQCNLDMRLIPWCECETETVSEADKLYPFHRCHCSFSDPTTTTTCETTLILQKSLAGNTACFYGELRLRTRGQLIA